MRDSTQLKLDFSDVSLGCLGLSTPLFRVLDAHSFIKASSPRPYELRLLCNRKRLVYVTRLG